MGLMDRMTEMVAGRQATEQYETRRLERQYAQAGRSLKEVKTVSFEQYEPSQEHLKIAFARTDSLPSKLPKDGTIRRGRPPLQRSQSELAEPKRPILPSPTGPPDISAIDLSDDQLQRTYSHDNVWDSKKQSLPPLPQLVGFGRYRRSIDAPTDWEAQKLHRQNIGLPWSIADRLGDLSVDSGMRTDSLNRYRTESFRSDSFASVSSKSSHTEENHAGRLEEKQCPVTGVFISRGFVPSYTSSTASSSKTSGHSRKYSNLSTTSVSSDAEVKDARPPSRRSTVRSPEPIRQHALTTIEEANTSALRQYKKVAKPCVFDATDDCDAAAVSDESEDDADWIDEQSSGVRGAGLLGERLRQVSQGLETKAIDGGNAPEGHQDRKVHLERSKTLKPPAKPNLRGVNSRNKHAHAKKVVIEETTFQRRATSRRIPPQPKVTAETSQVSSSQESDRTRKSSSDGSPLSMVDVKNEPYSAADSGTTLVQDADEDLHKAKGQSQPSSVAYSNPTESLDIEPEVPIAGLKPPHNRRNRSATVVRLFSGTVPQVRPTVAAASHDEATGVFAC